MNCGGKSVIAAVQMKTDQYLPCFSFRAKLDLDGLHKDLRAEVGGLEIVPDSHGPIAKACNFVQIDRLRQSAANFVQLRL
jgi:hypothetical protein